MNNISNNVICQIDWTAVGTWALAIIAFATIFFQRQQFNNQRKDDYERAFKTSSLTAIIDFDHQFNALID